ncbi:MAG: fluoride efflux transporter CrcB [Rhodothalassiaceae bacterium]
MAGWLWVMLGSALGGSARFLVSGLVARRIGETFPWGTVVVNVTGSLLIGIAAGIGLAGGGPASSFAVTGFLGSYTTVSSFSLQTLALAREGAWLRALANIVLSLALCLLAAAAGLTLAGAGGRP